MHKEMQDVVEVKSRHWKDDAISACLIVENLTPGGSGA
jgi:hypothetical protein